MNIADLDIPAERYPVRVIQFGEGNFLRAFIEWQLQQMNKQGLFGGSVAIVQPLPAGMVALLDAQHDRYTVVLEGLADGERIQTHEIITVVDRTVNPYERHDDFLALADIATARFIFSNTTEAGICFDPNDRFDDRPAGSFPGKLTQLLYRRFTNTLPGFHIIPCELIEHNGEELKRIVLDYVALWDLGDDFARWIDEDNRFYTTLVDRIVPGFPRDANEVFARIGYEDNLLVVAEPFLFFAIAGDPTLADLLPLSEAGLGVVVTDDVQPYRERKVRLLNGPHTTMAALALLAGLETVGDVMADPDFSSFIDDEMTIDIMATIDLPRGELAAYASIVQERYANPFVRHELTSIALNSISKFTSRLLPALLENLQRGTLPPRIVAALAAWLVIYRGGASVTPRDTDDVLARFAEIRAHDDFATAALAQQAFWGTDLTAYPQLVAQVKADMAVIVSDGPRRLVRMINGGEK